MSDDQNSGRRGFFKSIARIATGGLLVGGVGWLSGRSGKACLREFKCRGCPALDGCGEPQAILQRRADNSGERLRTAEDGKAGSNE